jgi:hypothetical protein
MTTSLRPLLTSFVLLTGTMTFLVSTARLAPAPARFDEADFIEMSEATARYGAPRIPLDDEPRIDVPALHLEKKYGQRYGMWHPPLYIHSVALIGRLFGFADATVRLVGVAWLLLTLLALWLCLRETGAEHGTWPLLVGLIGLTPLLREGALFIDIDNTALTTPMFFFLALFLRNEDRRDVWAIGGLAAGLWAKLTTPVVMLAAAGAYQIARGKFRFGAIQLGLVTLAGVTLFAATYAAYCVAHDYPWRYTFEFTFLAKKDRIVGQQGLVLLLKSIRWNIVSTSPAVTLSILTAFTLRVRSWVRERRVERIDLFVIFCALGITAYVLHAATTGKYTYPVVVAGLLVVVWELTRGIRSEEMKRPILLGCVLIVLAVAAWAFVPNLQFKPPRIIADSANLTAAMVRDPRMIAMAAGTGLSILAGLVGLASFKGTSPGHAFLTGLVLGAAVFNPIDAWKGLLVGYDGRGPLRPRQEDGYIATVDYLASRCSPGQIVMAPKDIGIRLARRIPVKYVHLEQCQFYLGADGVRQALVDQWVRFLVVPTYLSRDVGFEPQIEHGFRSVETFGDFAVYEFDR